MDLALNVMTCKTYKIVSSSNLTSMNWIFQINQQYLHHPRCKLLDYLQVLWLLCLKPVGRMTDTYIEG